MQIRNLRWKMALDVATSLAMIAAAGTVAWSQFNPRTPSVVPRTLDIPKEPVSILGATLKGSPQADAVLIMYSDFQCPFCRQFATEVLPHLQTDYVSNGKLLLAFRHFPLPIHPLASDAAVAAECAGKQDRFWEMHDRVFGIPRLAEGGLVAIASSLGLSVNDFEMCLQDNNVSLKVAQDVSVGKGLGVAATPSFFLGTTSGEGSVKVVKALSGAKPLGDFRSAIEALLQ
jgi:protein-disulfide isomerase